MTKSKVVLYFCLAFVGGVFLESLAIIPQLVMLGILILGILLISVFWRSRKLAVAGFCVLFLILGIWRQQTAELAIADNQLRRFNDLNQDIALIGVVSDEPDIRDTSIKLTIKTEKFQWNGNVYRSAEGSPTGISSKSYGARVLATARRYPEYRYGDKLKIVGKLKSPVELEDFNYPGYLAKDGIYSVMYWPKIELLERGNYRGLTSIIYAEILEFKNKLRGSIYQNLSAPQNSILAAMILGDKSQMSDELKNKLNITGLRHITAISGMHITILSIILMEVLIGFGLWRRQAFYLTLTFLIFYIVMIGLPASAVRAGIMGGLFLLAQRVGRLSVASRLVIFAAAGMLLANPLLLRFDVGFQLSFLAVMGIIELGSIFQNRLKIIPDDFLNLRSILSMTLSAQIFTLPILVYNFSRVSLVSPLTNILVLPTISFIISGGFLFALAGAIWQPIGFPLSLAVWLILTYLLKIIDFFSQPWAVKTFENVHWAWLIISYLVLGIITRHLKEKEKLKILG